MPLAAAGRLAHLWHGDRLRSDWRRKSPAELQEILAGCGLASAFWQLQGG